MLTAIALDDERPALDVIETFAAGCADLQLAAVFVSVGAARRYLQEQSVDLVFLDINMPAQSGMAFARELPAGVQVIFTTSYSEFAVESYELPATDYLLKPFTRERFLQAVDRAAELAAAGRAPAVEPLLLRVNYGVERVTVGTVRYVEALDNYLRIHREGGKPLTVRMTMKELRAQLPKEDFVRIHRSYIVRLGAVTGYRGKSVSIGEKELPLGATYATNFRRHFGG